MSRFPRWLGVVSLAAVTSAGPLAQDHQHPGGRIGTVHFQTSCTAAAQTQFDRAMAWLHSFEFGAAIEGFNCHGRRRMPAVRWRTGGWRLRAGPTHSPRPFASRRSCRPASRPSGRPSGSARRPSASAPTSPPSRSSTWTAPRLDQRTRVLAYERAMAELAAKYPDDREASIFWALSLAASALPTDKTYANQLKAGAILEKLYPAQPDHPGITHYIIHSYDVPALADKRDRGRAPVRGHRAGRAARAAHAVAHVHARRRLAGIDRLEHRVGGGRAKRQRARRSSCTRWTT